MCPFINLYDVQKILNTFPSNSEFFFFFLQEVLDAQKHGLGFDCLHSVHTQPGVVWIKRLRAVEWRILFISDGTTRFHELIASHSLFEFVILNRSTLLMPLWDSIPCC